MLLIADLTCYSKIAVFKDRLFFTRPTFMKIRFSVIIPAFNEEKFLPRLLDSIEIARANYKSGEIEIIVADNSSTDKTAEIAKANGVRVVQIKKRRIASARNGGAKAARGEVFCFIDADSALHPQTFEKIDRAMLDSRFNAGATGVYLERKSPGILLAYCFMMPFCWLANMDTGVVFCRREDFKAVGGYNEDLFLAEDIAFLVALKKRGSQNGQKFKRISGVKALGSTRKFDAHGDWHYFSLLSQVALIFYKLGLKIFTKQDKMSELTDYWYKPQR